MKFSNHNPAWSDMFEQERTKLLSALGHMTEGGIVEAIAHVGGTSVPSMPARPCIDIALHVWPFPLEASALEALAALGCV